MTRYVVDVCQYLHTCPAHPDPHVYDTRNTVVERISDGPCRQPQPVRCGTATVMVDCHRRFPSDRQCPACQVTIVVRQTTTVDTGRYLAASRRVPTGTAPAPCTACGQPLAAVLADWGAHLLCSASRRTRAAEIFARAGRPR